MDIETLKALGISPEELGNRIVEQCVETLLNQNCFSPEAEKEERYDSRFKREIEKRLQTAVDNKIAALAAEHIIPRVGEMIEAANMRQTNNWGEPKGEPLSFREYIAHRADVYMSEDVDLKGQSKAESRDSYWRSVGPRLTVLIQGYIRDTLERHAKLALTDVNKAIADNLAKAARDAITKAAATIKVSVSL